MIRAWHTSPFIKIAKRRITAAEPRFRQLMYALYIRVVVSVALSCSSSVYRFDEPCKSSMPIAQNSIHPEPANSRTFSTLGLSFSWALSLYKKNARQVTSVFELYFSVSGVYFFAFFSLPRPLRNLRKPPFLPLSISSIPASARSFISPIDQDAIAR